MTTSLHPSFHIEPEELENQTLVTSTGLVDIYEATRAGEKVVVKKLTASALSNDSTLTNFKNETFLLSNFHSSYVVGLYAASLSPPNVFQVLENAGSLTLASFLYDNPNQILSWDKRWGFARDLAVAMNYLHSRNPPVVHGDLRSDTLLISEDGKLKVTLSKFGRPVPSNLIKERWLAPEVGDDESNLDEASDVFAYGCILHEIATRKVPFAEVNSVEEIKKLWKKGDRPKSVLKGDENEFEALSNLCWNPSQSSRVTFKDIVKDLKRKGKISSVSTEKAQGRILDEKEKLQRENDILTQLRDNLEKKLDDAQRIADRESKRAQQLESEQEELERKYNDEKLKRGNAEKENTELTRNIRKESEKIKDIEEAKKEAEKKARDLQKKEDADKRMMEERAVEDADKRIQEVRAKVNKIKAQVEEAEKRADAEEIRRIEAEKRLASLNPSLETERKLKEEAERQRDVAAKKLKSEKRKAELEKKKREDLEKEIEEEMERLRKRR